VNLLIDGMGDEPGVLALDGMAGTTETQERDPAQHEFFTATNFAVRSVEDIQIEHDGLVAGETVKKRQRGVGQFGIFRKATSDQTDWKLRVYADANKTELLAEFEG